jgi:hypothetical protein
MDEDSCEIEYGLVLPNGEVVWNTWKGQDFSTLEGRARTREVLSATAVECGWEETGFTNSYGWKAREVHMHPGVFGIDNSDLYPPQAGE